MYINPYQDLKGGKWYKTNFHTHAGTGAGTCGANPIDKVVDLYSANRFDMLCISNHDLFSDTSAYTNDEIFMIPGVEYSTTPAPVAGFDENRHMLTIGVDRALHAYGYQEAIDRAREMGGFTIICHPNWIIREWWKRESLLTLKGYMGLEVINMLIYRLQGSGLATDTWDWLLSQGRLVYGFGNDDFHIYSDAARSYNLIYCTQRSYTSMKAAVESGALCASTGLLPEYLLLEGDTIRVKAKYPVETYVDTLTYRFLTAGGKVLSVQQAQEARYTLSGEPYVRVEVLGENGAMLFFQPVYLQGALSQA